MSDAIDRDIVIVGAGMAGLALACALADTGFSVAVVESGVAPALPPSTAGLGGWDNRVSALTPATSEFLGALGVWQAISDRRVGPYTSMQVWDGQGTGSIGFSADESGVPVLGHIVENRITVAALLAAADRATGITSHWGESVEALSADRTGRPLLRSTGGTTWTASLVIGADGARSRLRELADFPVRRWAYRQQAIVATVGLAGTHEATCWQVFLPTGPLALLPLADPGFCSIVWSLDEDHAAHWAECDSADFVAGLNAALAGRGPIVDVAGPRAVFPLVQCHAMDYVQPGLALVADAAHSIHPLAGQGINLGLADVAVLAEELTRAAQLGLEPGAIEVLGRYQRRRKGENLAMMAAMEAFKRGFGSDLPLVRVARNAGLDWVNGLGPLKQWFVRRALG